MRPKWGWGRAPAAEVGVGKGLAARMRVGPWGNAHDWTMNGCVWLDVLGRVRLANWLVFVGWLSCGLSSWPRGLPTPSLWLGNALLCCLRLKGGVGGWAGNPFRRSGGGERPVSPKWGWGKVGACPLQDLS